MPLMLRSLVFCACAGLSLNAFAEAAVDSPISLRAPPASFEPSSLIPPDLALARDVPIAHAYRHVGAFLAADAVRLTLLLLVPALSLWLVQFVR